MSIANHESRESATQLYYGRLFLKIKTWYGAHNYKTKQLITMNWECNCLITVKV